MKPEIPKGWTSRGELPEFDPAEQPPSPIELSGLVEDLWRASSQDESVVVDVGWYPQREADGGFQCVLVIDQDWENPSEQIETRSLAVVRDWLKQAVELARGRFGNGTSWPDAQFPQLEPVQKPSLSCSESHQNTGSLPSLGGGRQVAPSFSIWPQKTAA